MKKYSFILIFLIVGATALFYTSCKKGRKAKGIDKELLDLAKETAGYTWYKNSAAFLPKSSGSGHNYAFLRTRFNSVAAAMLDSAGMVKTGVIFPEGSVIVKELHSSENNLSRYAILYKKSSAKQADGKGWVWGYMDANGKVADPAKNKGKNCTSCHNQGGNIDYVLMNKFF